MRGIASGRLLRLHEQSLTVPDESLAQNRALRRSRTQLVDVDCRCQSGQHYDRVDQSDGLAEYAKSTEDAVAANHRHFHALAGFKFNNERYDLSLIHIS